MLFLKTNHKSVQNGDEGKRTHSPVSVVVLVLNGLFETPNAILNAISLIISKKELCLNFRSPTTDIAVQEKG